MRRLLCLLICAAPLLPFVANADEYAGRGGWGAKESVYRIRCTSPTGSQSIDLGTAFGHKSGNVISANHVTEPCIKANARLELVASDGKVSSLVVLDSDAVVDLVLLRPNEGFVQNPLRISSAEVIPFGAQVSSWGFPNGYSGSVALLTVGNLAGVDSDHNNPCIKRWVVNAAFNHGNSGGPLIETKTPSVIGVVILKLNPLTSEVQKQLKELTENGSQEAKVLAKAMTDIASRAQLVIGHAVMRSDLRKFLSRNDIEP